MDCNRLLRDSVRGRRPIFRRALGLRNPMWLAGKPHARKLVARGFLGDLDHGDPGIEPGRRMDLVPDISEREFVKTNGYYGYACGCLRGNFDARERRVVVILSVKQQALAVCSRDRGLPKP